MCVTSLQKNSRSNTIITIYLHLIFIILFCYSSIHSSCHFIFWSIALAGVIFKKWRKILHFIPTLIPLINHQKVKISFFPCYRIDIFGPYCYVLQISEIVTFQADFLLFDMMGYRKKETGQILKSVSLIIMHARPSKDRTIYLSKGIVTSL